MTMINVARQCQNNQITPRTDLVYKLFELGFYTIYQVYLTTIAGAKNKVVIDA